MSVTTNTKNLRKFLNTFPDYDVWLPSWDRVATAEAIGAWINSNDGTQALALVIREIVGRCPVADTMILNGRTSGWEGLDFWTDFKSEAIAAVDYLQDDDADRTVAWIRSEVESVDDIISFLADEND